MMKATTYFRKIFIVLLEWKESKALGLRNIFCQSLRTDCMYMKDEKRCETTKKEKKRKQLVLENCKN